MTKKVISLLLSMTIILMFAACGQTSSADTAAESETADSASSDRNTNADETPADPENSIPEESSGKILIAYFSWSGNTKEMASYIAEQTGGDLYEIEPTTPYSDVYEEVGEIAKTERDENARPEIANLPESIEEYDTILIGYPIWWHTAPMIIGTFLEAYDLTDVDVYPFTQSASMDTEQFENSMEFVRNSAGNANVHDGLFAEATDTEEMDAYLSANKLLQDSQTADSLSTTETGKILIAYFSVMETDGVDTVSSASRIATDTEPVGNTQYIAQQIQTYTGGDIFAIETVQDYPGTHDELLAFAKEEMSRNARPELATQIENIDEYDTIFLGYPIWNADLPMPLYTFLEEYDFDGKTIIPFTVHGGSGFAGTIQTIQELQPNASVLEDSLSISRADAANSSDDVASWIQKLNLKAE